MSNCQTSPNDSCGRCTYNAKCVIYKGQNLSNINVYKGDNLQYILEQINNYINGGSGTITGADNIGAGEGIFAQENSGILEFKSLLEGSGINISADSDEITISLDSAYTDGLYWKLLGNSGTDPSVNFLGTTDDESLMLRVNNEQGGFIASVPSASPLIAPNGSIVAIGQYAGEYLIPLYLAGDTTDMAQVLIGWGAGRNLGATWDVSTRIRSNNNTFVGNWSGYWTQHKNETYNYGRNTGVGMSTLFRNISGAFNNAFGVFALEDNNKGNANNAFGDGALRSNIDGDFNAGFGASVLLYNSTGLRSITIDNGGTGYTNATITISAPYSNGPGTCYAVATAVAVIDSGSITDIVITNPGCGYSSRGGTFYPGYAHPAVTVTITGDGTGALATANLQSGTGNTAAGTVAGEFNRLGQYNSYFGYGAGQSTRWWDENNVLIGHSADIDSSISADTLIEKSTAIGYNAKVGASLSLILGATGADQPNVGIGTIAPTETLHLVGSFLYDDSNQGIGKLLMDDGTGTGIAKWTTSPFPSGSGTLNYVPLWTPNGNTLGDSIITQTAITGGSSIGIDDLARGTTTTNAFLLSLRNSYDGDASASAIPMLFIRTQSSASTTQKYFVGCSAPNAPVGTSLSNYFGRALSSRNVYLQTFVYVGSSSTGNYMEEQFHSVVNVSRRYASGNTTFGSSVTADNGYKVEIGGTAKINSTLYLETVANDNTETKLLTWNSTTKNVEYLDVSSLPSTDTNFANTDLTFTGNRLHDGNTFSLSITNLDSFGVGATDISLIADSGSASLNLQNGGTSILNGDSSISFTTNGIVYIQDGSLATASAGYVWTLMNNVTGEGSWEPSSGTSSGYTVVSVTSATYNATQTSGEIVLLVDTATAGGNVTINLPTAVGNTAKFIIKKIDSGSNTITIDGDTTETIDGSTTATILYQYTRTTIISDNLNWYIID